MKASRLFEEALLARGWSNKIAAKELDCAPSYVSGLQGGRVTPSLALAARIEKLLGIPCALWADEKDADRARNRPGALGRQGRPKSRPPEKPVETK